MKKILAYAAVATMCGVCGIAQGAAYNAEVWSPIALSFAPAVEVPSEGWDVFGLRLNLLVGSHHDVVGLDVGGVASLQNSFGGIQCAGIYSKTDDLFVGFGVSVLNFTGTLQGMQVGLFNTAEELNGLQIGIVNHAYQAQGVQIGLVNLIDDSTLPIMPFVNMGF